ncbi:MAG TPA: VOC family protein [Blastocatellia bacterium]|nr:VOC family protein [Blastocatellia bacterium]
MNNITTFLMFEGKAEEAMNFYTSLFTDSAIKSISRYGENEGGAAGTVRHAVFALNGQEFMCIDSPIKHGFTFTPAMSLFVSLDTESELDKIYAALSDGGQILMPLGAYPFSKKYGWVNDKYGVSWQLTLADA